MTLDFQHIRGSLFSVRVLVRNCDSHFRARGQSIDELLNKCDIAMFKSSLKVDHCLNHIYVSKQHHTHCMTFRQRGHNFELPKLKYQTARSSFINGSLFNYV